MSEEISRDRRRYLGAAVKGLAAAELVMIGAAHAQSGTAPRGEVPTIRAGSNTSFASLKQIDAGVLSIGYAEAGPADAPPVILLHGWPYDIHSYVDVAPLLASAGYRVLVPYVRGYGSTRFLSSETFRNGQPSALAVDAIAFMDALRIAKLIWQIASPKWNFDDATFDRSAASFDNPDHVAVAIHNYRWRLALAEGEPKYDDLEKRLAAGPVITVPTITLEGDANGAPHPDAGSYAKKFSGKYSHRIIEGGIGHNLPQEAPQAFAQAVVDVDGY